MGELFAGPGYRMCSRSGCTWPAVATLGFEYSEQLTWLEDLLPVAEPATYDLCSIHAARFGPPMGWTVEDRRLLPEPLFEVRPETEAEAPAPPAEAGLPLTAEFPQV
jgi:hypothetical protein